MATSLIGAYPAFLPDAPLGAEAGAYRPLPTVVLDLTSFVVLRRPSVAVARPPGRAEQQAVGRPAGVA
jgi:hypothetical protein